MNNASTTYKAGDKLWFVPVRSGFKAGFVTITKVGRAWLSLSNGDRADRKTLKIDGRGYSPSGKLYQTREAHEKDVADRAAWLALRRAIDRLWEPPRGIDSECIRRCADSLGLTLEIKLP